MTSGQDETVSNNVETSENKNAQPQSQSQLQQGSGQGKSSYHNRSRSRNWGRDRDALYEKAVKLAQSGRVEFLENGVYNVIGDHGTYTVALDYTGKISCNCPGFIQKGKCSHAMAVTLITKNRKKR